MIKINPNSSYLSVSDISNYPLSTPTNTNFNDVLKMASAPKTMDSIFTNAAEKYQVPENLLKAVAKAESNFDPNAVSSAGAQGVMQLMPATARGLGVTDSFDAEQNIMGGSKYLSQLLKKYDGDIKLTLAAYNAGSGNVDKYGGIPPFKETRNYVNKVMSYVNTNISAPQTEASDIYSNIEKSIKGYDDYTYSDYRVLLEMLVGQIQNESLSDENGIRTYFSQKIMNSSIQL